MSATDIARPFLDRSIASDTALSKWPTAPPASLPPVTREAVEHLADRLGERRWVVAELPARWSDEQLRTGTWNLASLLMRPTPQYESGELIYPVEVRPGGSGASHYSASAAAGGLHTDGSLLTDPPHYALLLCLSAADEGGETVLVDVEPMRAHLAAEDPVHLEVLGQPHPFAAEDDPHIVRQWAPIISGEPGRTEVRYLRRYIVAGWQRASRPAPPGTHAALEALDAYVTDAAVQWPFALRRGQILLWENARFVHGRLPFVERHQRRRLVRIYGERAGDRVLGPIGTPEAGVPGG